MFRFTIRDVLWWTVLVALGVAGTRGVVRIGAWHGAGLHFGFGRHCSPRTP
jgi:hypothetical protein